MNDLITEIKGLGELLNLVFYDKCNSLQADFNNGSFIYLFDNKILFFENYYKKLILY